jgi:hypothetical protein
MAMLAVLSKMAAGNRHKKRLQVDSIPGGTDHPGLYIVFSINDFAMTTSSTAEIYCVVVSSCENYGCKPNSYLYY